MINDKRKLITRIAIPILGGGLIGFLTSGSMETFASLNQPPLSPPGWLFPVVWTILYLLMGISSYLIAEAAADESVLDALQIYNIQLIVNLLWPIFFFELGWYFFSLLWLIALWILVFVMIRQFYEISPKAALMNIPYLVWLTFAAYLNLGVWWLNR